MKAIGNTPLIKLEKLSEPGCADIYVKYEGANPTGSMKDRMALSMVEGAEKRGQLKPGDKVMDYTGGCFSGNSEYLKEKIPGIKCIAIEPYHVRALSGGEMGGKHKLEGIGAGFIPSICRLDLADEIVAVKDEDAMDTTRKLARTEGIFGGTTSGANVWTAIQRARKLGAGKKIVTVVCDSGLKYLNGDLYK